MGTAVITGGTGGIGRALAAEYRRRGFEVVVIGRNPKPAGDGVHVRSADLSRVGENRRLVAHLTERFPVIDALVLGARYHRSERTLTPDGFESNFALFYLSRFRLSHGLVGPLSRAEHPVVLNFAGAGQTGPTRWHDLQLEQAYHGAGAMGHAGRLNDLLGVRFADLHRGTGIRYVVNHPGVVTTGFAGEYDPVTAAQVAHLKTIGKPVATSVDQIWPYLEPSWPDQLTAVLEVFDVEGQGRRGPGVSQPAGCVPGTKAKISPQRYGDLRSTNSPRLRPSTRRTSSPSR